MEHHRIKTDEDILEIFLRAAVIDAVYREAEIYAAEVAELPDEAKQPLSRRARQTRRLCLRADRRTRFKKNILPWIKRIAWAVGIANAILFVMLMFTSQVREAVITVISDWFK